MDDVSAIGQGLYSGAATLGRITTIIGALIGSFIALVFIAFGIYMLLQKNAFTSNTTATIQQVSCSPQEGLLQCSLTLSYQVNGIDYSATLTTYSSVSYVQGQTITIYYDPQNPATFELQIIPNTAIGAVCIVIGAIILIMIWAAVYFARSYKPYAAYVGVTDVVRLL